MRSVALGSSAALALCLLTIAGGHAGPPATHSFDRVAAKPKPKATARAIVRGSPGPAPRLAISHIEITQGVQDDRQSIPIRAARAAYVRVLFNVTAGGGAAVALAGSGELTLPDGSRRRLANILRELGPQALKGQNGDIDAQRGTAASGLVFQIPAELVRFGTLTFRLKDVAAPSGQPSYACDNCATEERQFEVKEAAPEIRLTVVGISYVYQGKTYSPRPIDFAMVPSWLMRAYPISKVVYSSRVVAFPSPEKHPVVDQGQAQPLADEFDCNEVNVLLAQIRAADIEGGTDVRTHYFGLVYDGDPEGDGAGFPWMRGCAANIPNTPDPNATASGPTGKNRTFGWDESGAYGGWYTAHELGHTLGRMHVGGECGEEGTDPQYPFTPSGAIGDEGKHIVGFDPGDTVTGRSLAPVAVSSLNGAGLEVGHDVMSYCPWPWVSGYTYNHLWTRLVAEQAKAAPPAATSGPTVVATRSKQQIAQRAVAPRLAQAVQSQGPLLHVVARLDDGWTHGRIVSVMQVDRAATNAPVTKEGPVVETLDAAGSVLGSYPVAVFEFTDQPAARSTNRERPAGLVTATVPTTPAVAGVRIVFSGATVAESIGGSARPQLRSPSLTSAEPAASQPSVRGTKRSVARELKAPPSAQFGRHPVVLSWEATHAGNAAMKYSVQISTDGGGSWETVAAGLTTPQAVIAPENLSQKRREEAISGAPVRYKVIATDGFHRVELTRDLAR
jgi:hypothetical protein